MKSARWLCKRRCQRCGLIDLGHHDHADGGGIGGDRADLGQQRLPQVAIGRRHDLDRDGERPRRPSRARLRDIVGAQLDVQSEDAARAEPEGVAEGVARGRVELGDRQQDGRLLLAREWPAQPCASATTGTSASTTSSSPCSRSRNASVVRPRRMATSERRLNNSGTTSVVTMRPPRARSPARVAQRCPRRCARAEASGAAAPRRRIPARPARSR